VALGALSLAGCKQDVGDRCEQNSDCSSGICGDGQPMTSATGKRCQATLPAPPTEMDATVVDASDAAADASDAAADASDAAADASDAVSSSDATEAGAEVGDAHPPGDVSSEAPSDVSSDAPSVD
jgi:hypothetical protein